MRAIHVSVCELRQFAALWGMVTIGTAPIQLLHYYYYYYYYYYLFFFLLLILSSSSLSLFYYYYYYYYYYHYSSAHGLLRDLKQSINQSNPWAAGFKAFIPAALWIDLYWGGWVGGWVDQDKRKTQSLLGVCYSVGGGGDISKKMQQLFHDQMTPLGWVKWGLLSSLLFSLLLF